MSKKHGLGTVLLIGAAAAVVAGGVISYIKRAEIKRLAEDIITKVKPTDTRGVYPFDFDGGGQPDTVPDDLNGAGRTDAADAAVGEPNIVDSGISLESVEMTEPDGTRQVDEPKAEPEEEPETVETTAETQAEEAAEEYASGEALSDDTTDCADAETDAQGAPAEETDGEAQDEPRKKKIRFWSK